jgi:tRNA (guanine-N(7)-)-methyltransferase subunit TRM82
VLRIPALFSFLLQGDNTLQHIQTLQLPGNALALAVAAKSSETSIVVSVDNVHNPTSTTERRPDTGEDVEPLLLYKFQGHHLGAASTFKLGDGHEEIQSTKLTNLLYGLENLRKRDGEPKELE